MIEQKDNYQQNNQYNRIESLYVLTKLEARLFFSLYIFKFLNYCYLLDIPKQPLNMLSIRNYLYILQIQMIAEFGYPHFFVRTEESDSYSPSGTDRYDIEQSIESVCFIDHSVTLQIQRLAKTKQQQTHSREGENNRSFVLRQDERNEEKTKTKSMKNTQNGSITLADVPEPNLLQLLRYHRCLNLAKNDLYNRAYGAMFGFIIGDSIGAYTINKSYNKREMIDALMMEGGGVMNLRSGEATDEWQICLSLSEGLINCKGEYNHNQIAAKYLEWIDSNPFDLPVLMGIAFSNIRKNRRNQNTLDYSRLGDELITNSLRNIKQQSALGLIRLIPLVIWCINLEQYEFNHIIKQEMKLINPNQFVIETALLYANLLKCILKTGDQMQAYHQAAQSVYHFGSQKLASLWSCIEGHKQVIMTNLTANNLKFPFVFAINEMLEIGKGKIDLKKQFIESTVRVLSKGFNTDTNCSISLGLVGAVIGYINIPSYFKNRIINSDYKVSKTNRGRDYNSARVINVINQLIKQGPTQLKNDFF